MPIFVSRFSPARAGLANFRALRVPDEDVRQQERASSRQERVRDREEGDQTAPSGEDRRGASALLVTTQRADQIAQRVSGQNAVSRESGRRESNGRENGRSPETAQRSASAAENAPEASREERGRQAQTPQEEPETRVVLRPVLRSAAQRLDGLTRLIGAQRRGRADEAQATAEAARARLSTSLRIEQTAAQTDVVRTAQAAQVSQARQAPRTTEAAQPQPEPRAEDRLRETTELKQDLREDVATVARGLVRDAVRQNVQNARRIAQGTLQAVQTRPAATLASPLSQRAPLSQPLFSSRARQTPAIPNLSPLRSALALLGTNVNILVG
jgi:hypothetical protein